MDAGAAVLLAVAVAFAVGDWVAVQRHGRRQLEYVCKPATVAVLVALALQLDVADGDGSVRAAIVVALALSLVGDVFLMLPERAEGASPTFVAGLAAFLLAHIAYVLAFWLEGVDGGPLAIGAVAVVIAVVTLGRRIVTGVRASAEPELAKPVLAYLTVISLMVASAVGTGEPLVIAGAAIFYSSDALIAWNRFIGAQRHGRLAIIVTYHVAQALLALSITT